MKPTWIFIVPLLTLLVLPTWGQSPAPDGLYVQIYQLIQEGDALKSRNQPSEALKRYEQAQEQLRDLQAQHRSWNPNVVTFRLKYLARQLEQLKGAVAGTPAAPEPVPVLSTGVSRQALDSLNRQVRQLQAEKSRMEARLAEALQAQPASVDPNELARAEQQIQELIKEKSILQVQVEKLELHEAELAQQAQNPEALQAANAQIEDQANTLTMLRLERDALQFRLQELSRQQPPIESTPLDPGVDQTPVIPLNQSNELEQARQALLDAANQVSRYEREIEELTEARTFLQAQVGELTAENRELREEKAVIRAELQQLRDQLAKETDMASLMRQLNEAKVQLAAHQSANTALQQKTEALEQQVEALEVQQTQSRNLASENQEQSHEIDDLRAQIKELELELAETQGRVETKNTQKDRSREVLLNNEIVLLKSRLEVLEAQKIPYTEEELALFQESTDEKPASDEPTPSNAGLKSLPAGASSLITRAQQAFLLEQYDTAEGLYQQILELDRNNPFTLAQLAATQIRVEKFAEAEANLQRALENAPRDPRSLRLMGLIKFRQKDYDGALDALSLAAKADPSDPETQTYLGITLSEKGLRGPAETALRRAVQLSPGDPRAHYNLAVVYALQDPPYNQLAKWHYRKAVASGLRPNKEFEDMIHY